MPNTYESLESGSQQTSGSAITRDLVYDAWPYATADLAETAVLAQVTLPTGWVVKDLSSDPLDALDEETWRVEVTIGTPEGSEGSDGGDTPLPQFSFDIGNETRHVTYAQSQTAYGPDAPDLRGGIGLNRDGRFEGADTFAPTYAFSETHYFTDSQVTAQFRADLFVVAGSPINNSGFRGFLAGEVLFLGASGSRRDDGLWEITFNFAASPNLGNLTYGDITGVFKPGWAREDVYEEDFEDTASRLIFPVPRYVYINEVPTRGNFALLGIGVL